MNINHSFNEFVELFPFNILVNLKLRQLKHGIVIRSSGRCIEECNDNPEHIQAAMLN